MCYTCGIEHFNSGLSGKMPPAALRRRLATQGAATATPHPPADVVHLELVPRFHLSCFSDVFLSTFLILIAGFISFIAFSFRNEVTVCIVCAAACIARYGMTARWPQVTRRSALTLLAIGMAIVGWTWIPWVRDLSVHKLTIGVAFNVHLARSGFYLHLIMPAIFSLPHWRSFGADAVEMDAIGMPVYSWITLAMVIVVIFGRLRAEPHLENRRVLFCVVCVVCVRVYLCFAAE